VNRALEVARTILNRAARVWRDGDKPLLGSAPLIELLSEAATKRRPRPLSWAEQARLMAELPQHLRDMVSFAVNTGARDENVCGLRWAWERPVLGTDRSVFIVPAAEFKGKRDHTLVLNDAAWSIVQSHRGRHPEFVFVYQRSEEAPHRVGTMNNTAWQKARKRAGLDGLRVHDLRHAYGQRLRAAMVSEEDRAALLGHAIAGMPQHYADPVVARLIGEANKVAATIDRTTMLRIVNG
jgi:integrase